MTLFNRGQTNPELFPEAEKLRGDRDDDLSALAGRTWDAVVDTSAYVPQEARPRRRRSRTQPATTCSSRASPCTRTSRNRSTKRARSTSSQEGQPVDRLLEDFSNYGPLKVLCERAVAEGFGGPTGIVRPGLIVGPHDPTGRFTYWPHRVARGGEILAPRPSREPGSVHRRPRSRRVDRPPLRATGRRRLQRGES